MTNLLDLMTPEDRQIAQRNYKKRLSGTLKSAENLKIPPEVFLVAELGFYYGWQAIETVKRGYVESFRTYRKDRKIVTHRTKIPFSMDEAYVLVEAAKKIASGRIVDDARGTQVGVASALAKNPQRVFDDGIKVYKNRAKL